MTEPKFEPCELVAAGDARMVKRNLMTVDGSTFTAKAAPLPGSIRIRALNVLEHLAAMKEAARSVQEAAKDLGLEKDPDFLQNYRTACALHLACLSPDREIPAWSSPVHLMKSVHGDELALLMGQYTNALRLLGIGESHIDAEKAEGLAMFLAVNEDANASISYLLANYTPAYLALLNVLLSVKVKALVDENKSLRDELQKLMSEQPKASLAG